MVDGDFTSADDDIEPADDRNDEDERYLGYAASPDECISMATANGCDIANFYEYDDSLAGYCYCQMGSASPSE